MLFTATVDGQVLQILVTPGTCSDGMSDRGYPFTVTVRTAGKTLRGCGWTDRHPATGPGR